MSTDIRALIDQILPGALLLGIDYETYYDQEYSLRRMPSPHYIRDERFMMYGAAVKLNDRPAFWLDAEPLQVFLNKVDPKKTVMVGHNLAFDGDIASLHNKFVPAVYIDTLALARALIGGATPRLGLDYLGPYLGLQGKVDGGKALNNVSGVRVLTPAQKQALEFYAIGDIDLTYGILGRLLPAFPLNEIPVQDWTIRMVTEPRVYLDPDILREAYDAEVDRKFRVVENLGVPKGLITSNDKFALLLKAAGLSDDQIPMKRSKTTKQMTYAFSKADEAFSELQYCGNEVVEELVIARLALKSSIEETRAKLFLDLAEHCLPAPVTLLYSGAKQTHRLAGGAKMNLQNLRRGSPLRRAIKAPEGYVLVAGDSSNVELRTSMMLAGQADELEKLANGGDLYSEFATDLFNVVVNKDLAATDDTIAGYRQIGKIAILSLGYQSGWKTFQDMVWVETAKSGPWKGKGLRLDDSEAKRIVFLYRQKYAQMPRLWRANKDRLALMASGQQPSNLPTNPPLEWHVDRITGPSGLELKYPGMRHTERVESDEDYMVRLADENDADLQTIEKHGDRMPVEYRAKMEKTIRYKNELVSALALMTPEDLKEKAADSSSSIAQLMRAFPRKQTKAIKYINYGSGDAEGGTYIYGGKLTENESQFLTREIITWQGQQIGTRWPVVLQVHDELVLCVPEVEAEEAEAELRVCMKTPPPWWPDIPLNCEVGSAIRYGDIKKH